MTQKSTRLPQIISHTPPPRTIVNPSVPTVKMPEIPYRRGFAIAAKRLIECEDCFGDFSLDARMQPGGYIRYEYTVKIIPCIGHAVEVNAALESLDTKAEARDIEAEVERDAAAALDRR